MIIIDDIIEAMCRAYHRDAWAPETGIGLDWNASERQRMHRILEVVEGYIGSMPALSNAAVDVLAERRRQIEVEGWTTEHDEAHGKGEMARAAACYAWAASLSGKKREFAGETWFDSAPLRYLWPWSRLWWKPTTARRDLVKAGALILAEIERHDRAAIHSAAAATTGSSET